ncbi:hypothetical protein GE09DRAFT_1107588 [Coniochaeta sp. 2T2.1]|nr:hypothetical protein GE09DRAFT_1107588 [Coniochaeta sp. 2T2.1]
MPVENASVEGNEEGEEDKGEEDEGEEDEGEEDDGDEEEDDGHDATRDALLHPAPPSTEGQSTVHVESKAVIAMYRLMRKPSWTNNGMHWARDVLHPPAFEDEPAPEPRTPSGNVIWKHVIFLKRLYRSAPSVRRLARQNDFLRQKHDEARRAIAKIRAEVQGIRRKHERLLQDDKRKLELIRLRDDLINWIIPSLVILLREFFFLGCSGEEDKDGYWGLPSEGGEFTATTLTVLGRITGWIYLLAESIRDEAQLSRPKRPDQGNDESSTAADNLPYDRLVKRAEERMKLYDLAKQFRMAVNDALAELDEKAAEAAGRLKEKEERFRQVQAEREQEAREAEEKRQRHYEIMRADAQRAREEPYAGIDPLSLLWIKRQEEDRKREAKRQRGAERERMGSPQLDSGVFGDESPVRQARDERRRGKQPAFVLHDDGYRGRMWTEYEIEWLGDRLEEGGVPDYESWAKELRCKVEDVKAEADRQRQLMRDLARKKGKRAPAWALA